MNCANCGMAWSGKRRRKCLDGSWLCAQCYGIRRRNLQIKYNRSEKGRVCQARYRASESSKEYRKIWKATNRDRIRQYNSTVTARLANRLRVRVNRAVQSDQKAGSAVCDLGLSIESFKAWIEGQFEEGMTWDNYGKWHLDHVRPLAAFDLTNRVQFLEACNWYNYQPLWALDNLKKGAR